MAEMKVLFDPGKGRRNYKIAIEAAYESGPVVPHVGEQQGALVFTYEGNKAIDENGLLNVYRWRLAYKVITSATDLQEKEYNLPEEPELLGLLYGVVNSMPSEMMDEDQMSEMSQALQPDS